MKVAVNTANILRNVPLPDEAGAIHTNAGVLDMGAHSTRLGFAGDNIPRLFERTVAVQGGSPEEALCLDAAYQLLGQANVVPVIHKGTVSDWSAYECVLQRVDDMLQLDGTDANTSLLLAEKALVPPSQRQRMAELLFEKHGLRNLYFGLSPSLALYAAGQCTGLSVELGHEQCHVAPVFQGLALFHAIHCLDMGGKDVTHFFAANSTCSLPASLAAPHHEDIWCFLKEKCAAVADSRATYQEYANGSSSLAVSEMEYTLPDGTSMHFGVQRFAPCEALFNPTLMPHIAEPSGEAHISCEVQLRTSASPKGIPAMIVDSVNKCDQDLSSYFLDNIHLSGGTSLFAGLPNRIEAETQALLPSSAEAVRTVADVERRDAVFTGGSILASLSSFQDMWVSRMDYDEVGSIAVVRGCL